MSKRIQELGDWMKPCPKPLPYGTKEVSTHTYASYLGSSILTEERTDGLSVLIIDREGIQHHWVAPSNEDAISFMVSILECRRETARSLFFGKGGYSYKFNALTRLIE